MNIHHDKWGIINDVKAYTTNRWSKFREGCLLSFATADGWSELKKEKVWKDVTEQCDGNSHGVPAYHNGYEINWNSGAYRMQNLSLTEPGSGTFRDCLIVEKCE